MKKLILIVLLHFVYSYATKPPFLLDSCLSPSEQLKPHDKEVATIQRSAVRVMVSSLAPIVTVGWNSTGHVVNVSGFAPYVLDLIAESAKLTYCWVPLGRDLPFDDTPAEKKGLTSRVADGSGDLIVGTIVKTLPRYRLIDFTLPIVEAAYGIMIPFPEKSVNTSALSQPFKTYVWIGLVVALVVVTIGLYTAQSAFERYLGRCQSSGIRHNNLESPQNRLFNHISYVVTILLGQGNYCACKVTTFRLIAGAWCLAASVLIPAYSGTLLAFIITPTSKPLVGSIFDVVRVPGLKVAVDAWRAVDLRLQAGAEMNSSFGLVAASIQKTIFRCNVSSQCMDKVLSGNYVYSHGEPAIDQMMIDDLKATGTCRFSKAKESYGKGFLHWGLPKNSPYRQDFDIGMLRLEASGLFDYWRRRFMKTAEECLHNDNEKPLSSSRLNLSQLAITFALLGIGYALGFLAFFIEKCYVHFYRTYRRPI